MSAAQLPIIPQEPSRPAAALAELAALGTPTWRDGLDTAAVDIDAPLNTIPWATVQNAADAGVRITLLINDGATGELLVETVGVGTLNVELRGRFDQSLGGQDLQQFQAACDQRRPSEAVGMLQLGTQSVCKLSAAWENRPEETGYHWVRCRAHLATMLSDSARALALARRLAGTPRTRLLIVGDVEGPLAKTGAFVAHGSGATPALPDGEWMDQAAAAYADIFQAQWEAMRLPSPLAFMPSDNGSMDAEISARLRQLTALLCWSWMSVRSDSLRFEGVRTIEFPLFLPAAGDLEDVLTLWRWAVGSPAIDRHEALQRAVTLSVYSAKDFGQSQSILKNARWFLDLAHRDAVAEALATRRQVREAALSKAADTAAKAADATGKAFDRVALQIAAAAGIIFAQYKALLDAVAAARLLGAILGLLLISAFASLWFDFRYIAQGLSAFKEDLKAYRETLSADDIAAIAGLTSLSRVSTQNRRRWVAALILHCAAAVGVLAAAGLLLNGQFLRVFP